MDGIGEIETRVLDILSEGPISVENMITAVSDNLKTPKECVAQRVKRALHEGLKVGYIQRESANVYSFSETPKISAELLSNTTYGASLLSANDAQPQGRQDPSGTAGGTHAGDLKASTSKRIRRESNSRLDAGARGKNGSAKLSNETHRLTQTRSERVDKSVGTTDSDRLLSNMLSLMDVAQTTREKSIRLSRSLQLQDKSRDRSRSDERNAP